MEGTRISFHLKLLIQASVLLITLAVSAANHADNEFDYRVVNDKDTTSIRGLWSSRDLSPREASVIVDEITEDTRVLIIEHRVQGDLHYGAVFLPKSGSLKNAAVIVLPTGLNQANPNINADHYVASGFTRNTPYSGFIKILPAFRGRAMHYNGVKYTATGDFCDAYDGATDDTIALVNVTASLFPEANFDQVLVYGASRGGNVGLLMAVRDSRVNTVISDMAPVDFYREDLSHAYGQQYQCQFLQGRSQSEARERMLASSPLFFSPNANLQYVQIHHGGDDKVVPPWNAEKITTHLENFDVEVSRYIYSDCGHRDGCMYRNTQHSQRLNDGVHIFLKNTWK